MTSQICVLVTGVGGRSVGHQVLHGLLLLGAKYRVVACDASNYSYGLYQVPNRYKIPRADSSNYLGAMRSLVAQEKVDVIIPGTEAEVGILAAARGQFEALQCTVVVNPSQVVKICSNKRVLAGWLEGNGFDVPRSCTPDAWEDLVKNCGFPIVAKPTSESGASRSVEILNSEAEIRRYLSLLPPGREAIFQEYVEGPESEYTVGVMISKSGEIVDSIVMKRNLVGLSLGLDRTIDGKWYALSTGYSQGYFVKNMLIQSKCEELALKMGARGPMNIQCRVDRGKVYIFEVHPRFSGSSSFRADVGFNEPDVLIRNFHLNESIGRLYYRTDVAAIRAFSNIVVPINELNSLPESLG